MSSKKNASGKATIVVALPEALDSRSLYTHYHVNIVTGLTR
jgi:hypothetical protein